MPSIASIHMMHDHTPNLFPCSWELIKRCCNHVNQWRRAAINAKDILTDREAGAVCGAYAANNTDVTKIGVLLSTRGGEGGSRDAYF